MSEIAEASPGCAEVFCDNQSTIRMAESDAFRPRTKHIDIRYHHIRQKIEDGTITVDYVSTHDMVAVIDQSGHKRKDTILRNANGFEITLLLLHKNKHIRKKNVFLMFMSCSSFNLLVYDFFLFVLLTLSIFQV
jgi:hypothetical protein